MVATLVPSEFKGGGNSYGVRIMFHRVTLTYFLGIFLSQPIMPIHFETIYRAKIVEFF